jgi:Mg2+ and Co2+ transporter CorA
MTQYLDSVMARRTTGTIVRLTVVAILSLIGTATTGFLGMNLIDETQTPLALKALYFCIVAGLTLSLTVYTIMKSNQLAEFHDVLADERLSWRTKLRAFFAVWMKR